MIRASKTLKEYLADYRGSQLRIKESTREQMAVGLRLFDRHVGHPVLICELTETIAVDWLSQYAATVSPRTVNSKRQAILTLWESAAMAGLCEPPNRKLVPRAKEFRRIPLAWTVTEIERLVGISQTVRGQVEGIPKRKFWPSLILAVWNTGARIGNLLSARTVDCNLAEQYIVLRAESHKSGCDQFFRLTDQAVAAIASHFSPRRELIWPWPWHRRQIWEQFKKIVLAAGLMPNASMGLFHKLRCSNLSYTAANGGLEMARQQAGHASAQTTLRHYIDPRIARRPSAIDVLPRLDLPEEQGRLF